MENYQNNENLISHLEALRETLLKCFISIGAALPFAFYFSPEVLDCLIKILTGDNNITFSYFSPAEVFILQMKIALVMALVVCFPYIARKLWDFILPALYDSERKFIKSIVLLSSGLFVCGVLFCLFVMLPLIINFGMSFSTGQMQAVFGISNVIELSLWLAVVFGLMAQMPLITHALIKSGFIDYETIADKRPYIVVLLLVLAAVLTPPDVVSQVMLFVPTYALFELGLRFSKRRVDKEGKAIT